MRYLLRAAIPSFVAACLSTFLASSCVKTSVILPGPPGSVIKSLEKFPFQEFLDSAAGELAAGNIRYSFTVATLTNITVGSNFGAPSQAELALAFRTSQLAHLTSLALLLPASGFTHTVTVWDSASGTVLAQINVPSLNAGHWTSVSLAAVNKAIALIPGRGYIVGYNSLAIGSTINSASPGNQLFNWDGIFYVNDNGGKGETLPILPFTKGVITFEAGWEMDYYTSITTPIFPGKKSPNESPQSLYGMVDIGYIVQ